MNASTGSAPIVIDVEKPANSSVDDLVDMWLTDSVISDEQAQRMHADVERIRLQSQHKRRHTASIAIEVLGYLGSAIIVVAFGLLVGQYWDSIPNPVIAAVAFLLTAAFIFAGLVLPVDTSDVAARLRSVLYVVACVTFAGAVAVIADEFLVDEEVALAAFASATLCAAALWWVNRKPLQHVAFYFATLMTIGLAVQWLMPAVSNVWLDERPAVLGMPSLAIWAFGATWLLLSWAEIVRPAELGKVLGGVAMLSGILSAGPSDWAIGMGLFTVALLAVLAFYLRDLGLLIVAAVGTLQILPMTIVELFPGAVAAAGALLVVGVLLVIGAIYLARHRTRFALRHEAREVPALALSWAIGVSAAVWLITIVVIVTVAVSASTTSTVILGQPSL